MSQRSKDSVSTRRRPLLLPLAPDDTQWRIVLVGPYNRARRALFARLNQEPVREVTVNEDQNAREGSFRLGDININLVDWPELGDEHVGEAYLKGGSFALCVDPFAEDQSQNRIEPFLRLLRNGTWTPHCVVLISESEHLKDFVEDRWEAYLDRHGLETTIFRVNCADKMSPEFFAKVFLTGVSDRGRDAPSIEVEEIKRS